ncbi:MAG: LacI family transcriptional regulator [Mesoaciditoga sp.]|uniref:LacI family DNA-binding transcriptional regulator n=1 Tax=Athalassotoga sp. TaxID=2022597 RepID=UPI000CB66D5C|nr:MAG: LacI family transcriptional regulator [Mesoaciditoga sp.]HEU23833.1 LacI family transcriptional regulator [Mesoaciditoga lauensis]
MESEIRRQPTILDVSKMAGVSPATVSRYLNSSSYVSNETKKKIEKVIKILKYKPSRFARNLKTQILFSISVVVPNLNLEFYGEIVDALSIYANQRNVEVMINVTHNLNNIKEIVFDFAFTRRIDGVILCTPDLKTIEMFSTLTIPIIALDWRNDVGGDLNVDSITIDNKKAAFTALSYLYGRGHRDFLIVTGGRNIQSSVDRLSGVELFAQRHPDAQFLIKDGDFTPYSGYDIVKRFLKLGRKVTAIFAFNDLMAFGGINAAIESGVRVPEDISVMGFDNSFISSYTFPRLTTVDQQKEKLGVTAASLMIERLYSTTNRRGREIIVPYKIVERESVKQIKG